MSEEDFSIAFARDIGIAFAGKSEAATLEDVAALYRVIVLLQHNLMDVGQFIMAGRPVNEGDRARFVERYNTSIEIMREAVGKLGEKGLPDVEG